MRKQFAPRRLTKRFVITAGCVIVIVAAGTLAWTLTAGSATSYRTATAKIGSVVQTLDSTGTLEAVDKAQLAFQISGQIASVTAAMGQPVTAGQVLATLDTSSLTSSVDAAQAAITSAQTKLASDEASENTSATSSTSTTAPASSSGSKNATISAEQAALTVDQHNSDLDSAQAKSDLTTANTSCAGSTGSAASGSGASGADSESAAGNGSGSPTTDVGGSPGAVSTTTQTGTGSTSPSTVSCASALAQVLDDEQEVTQDQQSVAQLESTLAKAVSGSNGGAGSSNAVVSSSLTAATPDQIAADQANLDANEAQLSQAQTAMGEGELVSPITGTVAAIGMSAGQNVNGGSSSAQIVVIGSGSFDVSTTIPVSDLPELKVGAKAYVLPDGHSARLLGTVTQLGLQLSSASSTDYPVTIALPSDAPGLFDGAAASVSIVVDQVSRVLTVPTSAVHRLARIAYVSELRNGATQNVSVTLGAVGDTVTQVSSGLKTGDVVVVADLTEPLPNTSSTTGRTGAAEESGLTGTGGFSGGSRGRSSATTTTSSG